MSLLDGLPPVFAARVGALAARFGDEPRATCGDCAMKPRSGGAGGPPAPVFSARARCCTYHPRLPAFLAGRALRRGGPGAARIRARLADPDGVSADGVRPPASHRDAAASGAGFGHEERLTCPFWSAEAPEGRGCTIHPDREAVCRTWHCRRDGGARAHAAWMALKELLAAIERAVGEACRPDREPPPAGATAEAWEAWFVACADRVDALGPGGAPALGDARFAPRVARVRACLEARDAPMPEVLIPTIRDWTRHARGVTLTTWSAYDPIEAPPWIFELLARLDGQTPWRAAADATAAAVGVRGAGDLVVRLYRHGALGPPEHPDVGPGATLVRVPR